MCKTSSAPLSLDPGLQATSDILAKVGISPTAGLQRRVSATADRERRFKLWEIHSSMLCSVVGTCLTLDELRKISRKLNLKQNGSMREYEIHGFFVSEASKQSPVSRLMHKSMDRRHQAAIKRFCAIHDAGELESEWERCMDRGEIPGPYWALMTHPRTPDNLIVRAFGEVHMLSHKVGALERKDRREKGAFERERQLLSEEMNKMRRRLNNAEKANREMAAGHAIEIDELKDELARAQLDRTRLREVEEKIEQFRNGRKFAEAARLAERLQQELERCEHRAERAAERARKCETELSILRAENKALEQTNRNLTACLRALDETSQDQSAGALDKQVDLAGRRIVYVGGRSGAMDHFRHVVEQSNGQFIHHDGGMEDRISRLPDAIDRGDAVICPIDCVSHSACQLAKKHCKKKDCPFVLLRSSGLSAFVGALNEIAGPRPRGQVSGGAS